ncbi:hypothetical protein Back11_02740 [Paenibacillus baekrokdamisoli]|uniref:Uncharacterized protein n=1 Tax=Paenibacillus baekrokdamisoli TaxID=1712516 RepID=A0A3G9J7I3_9BACL|nr:DUF1361 domain-containing protein [Paenibacillus baekrokdamisoli]MBB3072644.1 putative membrane protein [Paenibacillus baekrokdamisoli]BBH18929.1 hypothetical protein Back11_02740 [Paenibacillus baekrokdamisoli]
MKGLQEINLQSKSILLVILLAATLGCLSLGVYVRHYTSRPIYLFLNWDVFLAWVPAFFSLLIDFVFVYIKKYRLVRTLLLLPLGLMWLFFYPNAAYLITDMLHPFIHYRSNANGSFILDLEFWYHLILFFTAALIGLFLSIYSLYSVQELVRQSFGRLMSWLFAVCVLALSSFGIYIGRFIRWNSWDVIMKPKAIVRDLHSILTDTAQLHLLLPFTALIFAVSLLGYSFVYGFTYLKRL